MLLAQVLSALALPTLALPIRMPDSPSTEMPFNNFSSTKPARIDCHLIGGHAIGRHVIGG
jgi:hypothetical protein